MVAVTFHPSPKVKPVPKLILYTVKRVEVGPSVGDNTHDHLVDIVVCERRRPLYVSSQ
jgi:hypothetical protein